jgi:PIN domain nuclease of toxin-antitoxin system
VGHDEVIVADTQALVWWILSPSRLTVAARNALDEGVVRVAIISCLEIANLSRRKRIALPLDVAAWLDAIAQLPNIMLLPMTLEIAITAGLLGDPIRDPADRVIVSTALHHGLTLVTSDSKIRSANIVETIW